MGQQGIPSCTPPDCCIVPESLDSLGDDSLHWHCPKSAQTAGHMHTGTTALPLVLNTEEECTLGRGVRQDNAPGNEGGNLNLLLLLTVPQAPTRAVRGTQEWGKRRTLHASGHARTRLQPMLPCRRSRPSVNENRANTLLLVAAAGSAAAVAAALRRPRAGLCCDQGGRAGHGLMQPSAQPDATRRTSCRPQRNGPLICRWHEETGMEEASVSRG